MAAWPTAADLISYLGNASADRQALYGDVIDAAIDMTWGDLDALKMPDQILALAADRCPPAVRRAVLILAAHIDTRSQSTNGVIASGDLFFRVSREDPDYRLLIARYAVSAEP